MLVPIHSISNSTNTYNTLLKRTVFSKIAHSSCYHPGPVALKQSNLTGTSGDMDKQEASAASILCLKKDGAKHPSMHSALSRRQSGRPK